MIMRTRVEMSKDREVQLIDGVKVRHDSGWALALPDPEEPITHVWAEAATDAEARALVKEYARRIRQLLRCAAARSGSQRNPQPSVEGCDSLRLLQIAEELRPSADHRWTKVEGRAVRSRKT